MVTLIGASSPTARACAPRVFSMTQSESTVSFDCACKVEFTLTYGFASQTLATLVGPVFDKIAGSLVDAFVKRADQVYGA